KPVVEKKPVVEIRRADTRQDDDSEDVLQAFRTVEFRDLDEDKPRRVESRLLRWLGVGLVVVSTIGLAAIAVRPVDGIQGDIVHGISKLKEEPAPDGYRELRAVINEAEEALRDFYRSASVSDILLRIRAPSQLQGSVQKFYRDHPPVSREIEFMGATERVHRDHGTFILSVVKLPEAVEGRQVAVEMSEEGPKVDWELAVNYQKRQWLMLPRSPLAMAPRAFRVEASASDYYNHGFEESEWRSYRLTAPGASNPVYAYAPRRSRLGELLQQSITSSYPHPAQLVISLANSVQVDEIPKMRIFGVQHASWLLPPSALPVQAVKFNKQLTLIDNL
ncbi:hypothetical protein OAG35_01755, partial [bacterium]|nr:hypothetical protein [bacterium]